MSSVQNVYCTDCDENFELAYEEETDRLVLTCGCDDARYLSSVAEVFFDDDDNVENGARRPMFK